MTWKNLFCDVTGGKVNFSEEENDIQVGCLSFLSPVRCQIRRLDNERTFDVSTQWLIVQTKGKIYFQRVHPSSVRGAIITLDLGKVSRVFYMSASWELTKIE